MHDFWIVATILDQYEIESNQKMNSFIVWNIRIICKYNFFNNMQLVGLLCNFVILYHSRFGYLGYTSFNFFLQYVQVISHESSHYYSLKQNTQMFVTSCRIVGHRFIHSIHPRLRFTWHQFFSKSRSFPRWATAAEWWCLQ